MTGCATPYHLETYHGAWSVVYPPKRILVQETVAGYSCLWAMGRKDEYNGLLRSMDSVSMIESSPIGETLSFQQGTHFKLQSLLEGQKNIAF
jgi:hypothetical protein